MRTNLTYIVLEPELQMSPRLENARQAKETVHNTFLQRVVDACAANVLALDEIGKVLHVSRAWRIFLVKNGFQVDEESCGLNALQSCNATPGISQARNGLSDDVQTIIRGLHTEIHKEYIFEGTQSPRWFLVRAAKLDVPGAHSFNILVTLEDVTRRKLAEEELRQLGGRLIKAQEEERSRVGRDLHDDFSQRMAVLTMELEQLREAVPAQRSDLCATVTNIMRGAQELASDIHRLSYQLHPFKLDTLGLSAAVRSLCEEISNNRDLKIKFQEKGFPATLPPEIKLCIFRVAQEALHNIVKHSGASEAKLVLTKTAEAIRLRVLDRGCGFDIEAAKTKKRLGLLSMKERLRLVGGELSIRSRPSEGTQIDVLIPI